ncbi:MAG: hypothetical protein GY711_28870 [bacterium]|nr:hypothetical protein [bacterium]
MRSFLLLGLAGLMALPVSAQRQSLETGDPTRTGQFGVSIAVRDSRNGEAYLLSWEVTIDASILARPTAQQRMEAKAAAVVAGMPPEFGNQVSLTRAGNKLTVVPKPHFGDDSIDYWKDETNEGLDRIASTEPGKMDGLFSLEGMTSGFDAMGGPGHVLLDVGGGAAFVPTLPGMPADLIEDEILFQLQSQGVAAHLSTPADALLENYGTRFAGDGRVIVIDEFPPNGMLVDIKDGGLVGDVFGVIDRTSMSLGTNYCGPAVPNSTGQSASIRAVGSNIVALSALRLSAVDLPQDQFGYFLGSMNDGFVAGPGGSNGNLCLGHQIGRFVSQVGNSGSLGAISIEVDPLVVPVTPPRAILPGETWRFQCWFRDIEVAPTSNFTDGVWIEWQ